MVCGAGGAAFVVGAGLAAGSVLTGAGVPGGPASGWELAAMAAAAIASGAVEPPAEGVADGTLVGWLVTGMATATVISVVAVRPACWAGIVASAVEVSSPLRLSAGLEDPLFEGSDVVADGWVAALPAEPLLALLPALAFALEGGPALALLLGSLFAG